MKKTFRIFWMALAVLAGAAGVLRMAPVWDDVLGPGETRAVDFATLTLSANPNQYLVCPPGLCAAARADAEGPVFGRPVGELRRAFDALIAADPSVTVAAAGPGQVDLVARTRLLRWPDRVTVRFLATDDGNSRLAVYSRSVYGRSDFGANQARVTAWLTRLAGE